MVYKTLLSGLAQACSSDLASGLYAMHRLNPKRDLSKGVCGYFPPFVVSEAAALYCSPNIYQFLCLAAAQELWACWAAQRYLHISMIAPTSHDTPQCQGCTHACALGQISREKWYKMIASPVNFSHIYLYPHP